MLSKVLLTKDGIIPGVDLF